MKISIESLQKLLDDIACTSSTSPTNRISESNVWTFASALSAQFGLNFVQGVQFVQDSAHIAEIAIPSGLLSSATGVRPALRVSGVAPVYTITMLRMVTLATEERIELVAEQFALSYAPESMLGPPFDQRNRFNGDAFHQLFDYE